MFDLPFDDSTFDFIWNAGVLEHFSDPRPALIELLRVLKDGAYLLIFMPNVTSLHGAFRQVAMALGKWHKERNWTAQQFSLYLHELPVQVVEVGGTYPFPPIPIRNSFINQGLIKYTSTLRRIDYKYRHVLRYIGAEFYFLLRKQND